MACPSVQIGNGEEIAQVLQLSRFHLTSHVNQVLEAFTQALLSAGGDPLEPLDQLTPSFPPQILSAATETAHPTNPGTRLNVWIIDTAYISLPKDVGGVIPLSATTVNHRLYARGVHACEVHGVGCSLAGTGVDCNLSEGSVGLQSTSVPSHRACPALSRIERPATNRRVGEIRW